MLDYFIVALILVEVDALICAYARRRFRVWRSLVQCLLWPITTPILIFGIAWLTRNRPDFDNKDLRGAGLMRHTSILLDKRLNRVDQAIDAFAETTKVLVREIAGLYRNRIRPFQFQHALRLKHGLDGDSVLCRQLVRVAKKVIEIMAADIPLIATRLIPKGSHRVLPMFVEGQSTRLFV